jgi:exopolysaccharide biosynthesis predicted pyruvyltransferase EpsI
MEIRSQADQRSRFDHETLGGVLSEVADGGTVLTVQPGGNHGDTLIYRGFEKFVEGTEIDHVALDSDRVRYDAPGSFPSSNVVADIRWAYKQWKYARHRLFNDISAVYIHGGGNFNDMWRVGIECYRTVANYFDCPIVIGPQSCQFTETDPTKIFEEVSNETHFFCREAYSHEIIAESAAECDHVEVYLEDDTALHLTAADLPVDAFAEEYTLVAMRMDQDSAEPTISEDIPGPVKVSDTSKMEDSYEDWVNTAARASHIYTDRLHVAILGWILDKPITWYGTGYHKNRGVYEHSLAEEPGIEFHTG